MNGTFATELVRSEAQGGRSGRGPLPLVRGARIGPGRARAGDAAAHSRHRPGPGGVPNDSQARIQSRGTGCGHQRGICRSRHLDESAAVANPKIFIGYSDNTNLLNWLWSLGTPAYYGGSTQVHLGAGPGADDVHLASLRAALITGGQLQITDPGESEDFGPDWLDPRALVEYGDRGPTEPWAWTGPERAVSGHTWGGCLEVIDQLALADRLPSADALRGAILILETSELLVPADWVKRWVRALGERGVLEAADGVMVARPPVSTHGQVPSAAERARLRAAQRDVVSTEIARYNPNAVVCVGVPFGHTRPQWILPYGGSIQLDGAAKTVTASYA